LHSVIFNIFELFVIIQYTVYVNYRRLRNKSPRHKMIYETMRDKALKILGIENVTEYTFDTKRRPIWEMLGFKRSSKSNNTTTQSPGIGGTKRWFHNYTESTDPPFPLGRNEDRALRKIFKNAPYQRLSSERDNELQRRKELSEVIINTKSNLTTDLLIQQQIGNETLNINTVSKEYLARYHPKKYLTMLYKKYRQEWKRKNLETFTTPKEWLEDASNNDTTYFDIPDSVYEKDLVVGDPWYDDELTESEKEEDELYVKSLIQFKNMTDLYLRSHFDEYKEKDDTRLAYIKLHNITVVNQTAPKEWTPDIDRGITYTNEIIEMKSKISLLPYQESPEELYGNESFGYNDNITMINMVGTVREQYDWLPPPNQNKSEWKIDPLIVEKIKPVTRFLNHMAVLRSTTV
jgi:hypothetical protein